MQACPCGYYGDSTHECTCSEREINRYLGKISGPLLDRIDIHIEVTPVAYKDLGSNVTSESSESIRKRVDEARKIQTNRYSKEKIFCNAQLTPKNISKYCKLNNECTKLMEEAFDNLGLSARAYNKILKLARTIADLDKKESIEIQHLAEAIQYRSLDRKFWR